MATQFIGNLKTIMKNWFYDKDEVDTELAGKTDKSQTTSIDIRLTKLEDYSTYTDAAWNENDEILTITINSYKDQEEEEEEE